MAFTLVNGTKQFPLFVDYVVREEGASTERDLKKGVEAIDASVLFAMPLRQSTG